MKNTQKKKISRSYHLLRKIESGKCRRVTSAIDVIVTLCHKSVGKRVLQCPLGGQRCHAKDSFSLAEFNFELLSLLCGFFIFLSLLILRPST